ncbi:curved DNA-binding protein-like [Adelges cooleyi]|uniref:curved DNA-binding protein-like n=1 Tax=Adelges cooleyi TaxID=133065 RepID=UPI00217F4F79|nr:curved DNA-binding protein-like [Adelges cooleyi]
MSFLATRNVLQTVFKPKFTVAMHVKVTIPLRLLKCHCIKTVHCNFSQLVKSVLFLERNHIVVYFTLKRHLNTSQFNFARKNYYEVLGVPKTANQKEIKNAYYGLAMKHHPDKNGGTTTQKFRDIKEAYDILSNESSRMTYDNDFSNNNSSTSSHWTSNSSKGRYQSSYHDFTKRKSNFYSNPYTNSNYEQLRPHNIYINIVTVPKNVVKAQVDLMLFTFIKNRVLKIIMYHAFQLLWTTVLKNITFNMLIKSQIDDNILFSFLGNVLGHERMCVSLTELEAIRGKTIRVQVHKDEQVLIVEVPGGVEKNQSFILFYLHEKN